ncbi:hypothetical protein C8Q74DRAFT_1363313 [Fomes fomentarius]|nr:hypothetical protein C8Q74DRAFT_1363313 [Fomes fomentarius]
MSIAMASPYTALAALARILSSSKALTSSLDPQPFTRLAAPQVPPLAAMDDAFTDAGRPPWSTRCDPAGDPIYTRTSSNLHLHDWTESSPSQPPASVFPTSILILISMVALKAKREARISDSNSSLTGSTAARQTVSRPSYQKHRRSRALIINVDADLVRSLAAHQRALCASLAAEAPSRRPFAGGLHSGDFGANAHSVPSGLSMMLDTIAAGTSTHRVHLSTRPIEHTLTNSVRTYLPRARAWRESREGEEEFKFVSGLSDYEIERAGHRNM